jgi:tRNA modification GTPase
VSIIRVSGPNAQRISKTVTGKDLSPRRAEYLAFKDPDGATIDMGLALWFPAPNSFTGEDVLELQGHGGPVVMDVLLKRVLSLGARPAEPGEFSQRAFLNDKMDLAQAEAIADLIDSASKHAARLAMRSLQGAFSARIHELVERLIQLRMYVEAAIDFPEEEIDFLNDAKITNELQALESAAQQTLTSATQGCLLREGMQVVLAGKPNAGKSTLLNQLTGKDSAIVTEIPGTTRDVLREHIQIDGMPLHIIDTAGLRESEDHVELEGIRRAWREIEQADRILYLVDQQDTHGELNERNAPFLQRLRAAGPGITVVHNKIDTLGGEPSIRRDQQQTEIYLSAKTGAGMDLLRDHLKQCVGYRSGSEGEFMARRRHVTALEQALERIRNGRTQLTQYAAGELLAEELRLAQADLNQITGEFSSDDLLGRIFSSFCIGK